MEEYNTYEAYLKLMLFAQRLGALFASDIYRADYYVSRITKFLVFMICCSVCLWLYGAVSFWGSIQILEPMCICCFGITVILFNLQNCYKQCTRIHFQDIVKWCLLLIYQKELFEAHSHILEIHRTIQGAHRKNMFNWMQHCIMVSKLQVILYGFNGIALFVFPFVMYFAFGKKQLLFETKLPFIEMEFWTFLVCEMICCGMGTFGTFVVDFVFIITAFNAAAYINFVILDLHHIKETILKHERTEKRDNSEVTTLIRLSLIRHNAMQR